MTTDTPTYETLRLEYLEKSPPVLIANIRNRPRWSYEEAELRLKRINKTRKKGSTK